MNANCDQCNQDPFRCVPCKTKQAQIAARADRHYDELRIDGYRSDYERNAVEEMERSQYDK